MFDLDFDFNNRFVTNNDCFVMNPLQTVESQVKPRKISHTPYRVLDAPGLCDDFYLNLVDWSSHNILAVALDSAVWVWNATTLTTTELCDLGDMNQVTSLSWSNKGNHLSVGTRQGQVQIWDINTKKKVRTLTGHMARVSSLAWNNVSTSVIASGSKDRTIIVRDLRSPN
jgi:cell division cycle 20-like protein 1 (cofactor of APC complex)